MHHRQIANLQAVTSIFILHGHSLHAYCLGALRLKGGNAMQEASNVGKSIYFAHCDVLCSGWEGSNFHDAVRQSAFSLTSHSRSLKSERPLPSGRTLCSSIILRRVAACSSSQPSSMSRGEAAPEPGTRMCCTGHSALSVCQAQGTTICCGKCSTLLTYGKHIW